MHINATHDIYCATDINVAYNKYYVTKINVAKVYKGLHNLRTYNIYRVTKKTEVVNASWVTIYL